MVCLSLLDVALAEAQIYVIEDANGQKTYTSTFQPGATLFMGTPNTATFAPQPPGAAQFRQQIADAANEAGIEPLLVEAVIATESAFDPLALSHKGAQGLMQLMPETAERFNVIDVWDPGENIRGGAAYLKVLEGEFNGDLHRVLAAYNAGEGAVREHGGVPPYDETQTFVRRVLSYYRDRGGER
jgi:soluble lytic murein transglycosylase-like protein